MTALRRLGGSVPGSRVSPKAVWVGRTALTAVTAGTSRLVLEGLQSGRRSKDQPDPVGSIGMCRLLGRRPITQ